MELLLLLIAPFFLLALLGCHFWCGRLGWIISLFSEFVSVLAGWMAELSPLVSLRYPFVPVIMLLAVSAIVWMIVTDRGSWVHALIPFAAGSLLFFACVGIYNIRTADRAVRRRYYDDDAAARLFGRIPHAPHGVCGGGDETIGLPQFDACVG